MLKVTNAKISCLTLTSFTLHWSSTARSVRLVVGFISYFEMTESSELKEVAEADLLDAWRVYIHCTLRADNWQDLPPGLPWSLKMKRERTATPVAEFKSYLAFNHGFKEVATSLEIMKFSTKITMKQYDLFRTRDSGLGKYWKYLSSIIICIFKMICQVLE